MDTGGDNEMPRNLRKGKAADKDNHIGPDDNSGGPPDGPRKPSRCTTLRRHTMQVPPIGSVRCDIHSPAARKKSLTLPPKSPLSSIENTETDKDTETDKETDSDQIAGSSCGCYLEQEIFTPSDDGQYASIRVADLPDKVELRRNRGPNLKVNSLYSSCSDCSDTRSSGFGDDSEDDHSASWRRWETPRPQSEDDNVSHRPVSSDSDFIDCHCHSDSEAEESSTKLIHPDRKIKHIVREMLTTEEAYVKRLRLLTKKFQLRLETENRLQKMFPDDVIQKMFSNLRSICTFHESHLLPQLTQRLDSWEENPKIGDVLIKSVPFLKLYTEFIKNFDSAMKTIRTWHAKSSAFRKILAEVQKDPDCANLTLQHHMLEPIQRGPRYELLIREYIRQLPKDSDDWKDSKKALELVQNAVSHCNEMIERESTEFAKFGKLLKLQEKISGLEDLVEPGRELVKEGCLSEVSPKNGSRHERYVYLFNDLLLLCVSGLQQRKVKTRLPIEGMIIQEGDNSDTFNTFYVRSTVKSVELYAETTEEKHDWMIVMSSVVEDLGRRLRSRRSESTIPDDLDEDDKLGLRAPTLTKEYKTDVCMQCRSPFKMTKSRHHCEACGIVICNKCSSNKFPLPYQNNRLARVCDKCYCKLFAKQQRDSGKTRKTSYAFSLSADDEQDFDSYC